MAKKMRYYFDEIDHCNMCGAGREQLLIMGKRLNKAQGYNPHKKEGLTTSVIRCKKCGLIFSNPRPVPFDIQDHYGVSPETYWKEEYFKVSDSYFSQEITWFKNLKKFKPGMKSLDIGAGIGKQMQALQKSGFDVYGLEPGKDFYELAIDKMGIPKSKLTLGALEDTDFQENYFDFISFGAVLEHLYDPSSSIKQAIKWLKTGGLIHIEVPNSGWLISKLLNAFYKLRGLDYVTNLSPMHVPYHLYEFSRDSFIKNGKLSGYIVKDYKYYVCETFLPSFLDPLLKGYMKRTNKGMQLCVWLEKI